MGAGDRLRGVPPAPAGGRGSLRRWNIAAASAPTRSIGPPRSWIRWTATPEAMRRPPAIPQAPGGAVADERREGRDRLSGIPRRHGATTRRPGCRVPLAGCTAGTGRAVPGPRPIGLEPGGSLARAVTGFPAVGEHVPRLPARVRAGARGLRPRLPGSPGRPRQPARRAEDLGRRRSARPTPWRSCGTPTSSRSTRSTAAGRSRRSACPTSAPAPSPTSSTS